MTIQTIDQIAALPHKAGIYGFECTIQKGFKRSEGVSEHGKWSFERYEVTDPEGAKIKLVMKDHDPLNWVAGTKIRLQPYAAEKGQVGLYAEDDEYKGAVTRIVKATGTAVITILGNEAAQAAPAPAQAAAPSNLQDPPPKEKERQPKPPTPQDELLAEARAEVMKIANLHLLAARAVSVYEAPAFREMTGMEMNENQRQAAISSIFIEACRGGLVRKMSTKKMISEKTT